MDINNDNNNDLIIGDATGKVFYYPGTDNGEFGAKKDILFTDSTAIMFTGTVVSKPVMYDYNNDGLLDMLTANSKRGLVWEKHPINVHLNVGTAQNPIFKKQPKDLGIKAMKGSVAMGDMDGDNLPDLVVSNVGGDKYHVYFYKNIGTLEDPKWSSGQIVKFKNIPIFKYYSKTGASDGATYDSLMNTGENWIMNGKPIVNISISDYNNDGHNDLLLGYGGFGLSGESQKDGYKYTYQQTVINVYYNSGESQIQKASSKTVKNYISVNGDDLYFNNVKDGEFQVTVYSIKGKKLFTKTIENCNSERKTIFLKENSLAKGLYIVKVIGNGFNERIKIKRF